MAKYTLNHNKQKDHRLYKVQTAKLLDRLTYCPNKHKQKFTRNLRQKLQRKLAIKEKTPEPSSSLKFGSFNVNGLDLEASWAVEQLIFTRGFDVSYILK